MECFAGADFNTSQVKTSQNCQKSRTGQIVKWAQPLNDSHTVWHPSSTAVSRNDRHQKHHQRRNAEAQLQLWAAAQVRGDRCSRVACSSPLRYSWRAPRDYTVDKNADASKHNIIVTLTVFHFLSFRFYLVNHSYSCEYAIPCTRLNIMAARGARSPGRQPLRGTVPRPHSAFPGAPSPPCMHSTWPACMSRRTCRLCT